MPMGFAGYLKLASNAVSPMLALANSAGLELQIAPIYSEATIGSGWLNAALNTHYAENAIVYEGSMDIEVEGNTALLTFLRDWAIDYRAYARSVDISPDGAILFQHRNTGDTGSGSTDFTERNGVWCESMNFSASEGGFVTSSITGRALERVVSSTGLDYITNRTPGGGGAPANPLNPSDANLNPIPYWKTLASLYTGVTAGWPRDPSGTGTKVGGANTEAIDWSIDISNNSVLLYTCRGAQGAAAVLMGAQDVTGSVTLYNNNGIDDTFLSSSAATMGFEASVAGTSIKFIVPFTAVEASDYGLRGKSEVVSRSFSVHGIGDGVNPPIYIVPTV